MRKEILYVRELETIRNRNFIYMDLQTKKLHFIESILSIGNEKVIDKLEAFLKKEQEKETTQRVGIKQYNQELKDAKKRIESGEFTSHEDLKKESDTWIK